MTVCDVDVRSKCLARKVRSRLALAIILLDRARRPERSVFTCKTKKKGPAFWPPLIGLWPFCLRHQATGTTLRGLHACKAANNPQLPNTSPSVPTHLVPSEQVSCSTRVMRDASYAPDGIVSVTVRSCKVQAPESSSADVTPGRLSTRSHRTAQGLDAAAIAYHRRHQVRNSRGPGTTHACACRSQKFPRPAAEPRLPLNPRMRPSGRRP